MKNHNVAKISLEIRKCRDCPFVREQKGYAGWFCTHDLRTPGIEVNENMVPSWCPFVVGRLQEVLNTMNSVNDSSIPKKWINQIERKQEDHPDPKFGADHAWGHVLRVTEYGERFLEECVGFSILSNNEIQRLKLLLRISAMLHDVGLAESNRNHAIHSAEMAKKYLLSSKVDIDEEDVKEIYHAIYNHSDGRETRNYLDAALLIGDMLDVNRERMTRNTGSIIEELRKVTEVKYELFGKLAEPKGARLKYYTDGTGFDVFKLRSWPKAVLIPQEITLGFLGLSEFRFFVDEKEVELKRVIQR